MLSQRPVRAAALTNFGSMSFVSASATAAGHTGSISDPRWAATAISLDPSAGVTPNPFGGVVPQTAGATPGALAPNGSSFGVTWSV